jgi:TatD DNase family protein
VFLTDTHAHLHSHPLSSRADETVKKAAEQNVRRMITIGTDLDDSVLAHRFASAHPGVFAAVGVHPHDAENFRIAQLGKFEQLLSYPEVIAVGEVGLDFYRNRSPKDKQIEVFSIMADMALGANLPLALHTRDASEDTVDVLERIVGGRELPLLFHCFNGDPVLLEWGLKREKTYFSFAGNVTYRKATLLHEALERLPTERLFIETDCPYLTPEPLRGKENEPAYLHYTAEYVSKAKKISMNDLATLLEENFKSFFKSAPVA